jgi:hypothetical protein
VKINGFKLFFLFLLISLFSACTLQKRLYSNGFYISGKNEQTRTDTLFSNVFINSKKPIIKNVIALSNNSIKRNVSEFSIQKNDSLSNNSCDTILLKNGTKLIGTVTKTSDKKIYFKNCDSTNYFNSAINSADVSSIKYNGAKTLSNTNKNQSEKTKPGIFVKLGCLFILAFLALIILQRYFGTSTIGQGILMLFIGLILFVLGLVFLVIGAVLMITST